MVAKSLKEECDHIDIKLQIEIESKFCNKGQGALEKCSRQPVVKSHVEGYFFVTLILSFGFFVLLFTHHPFIASVSSTIRFPVTP